MAEIAVPVAIAAVQIGLQFLSPSIFQPSRSCQEDLESIQNRLETMQAYVRYTEAWGQRDEGTMNRVRQIRRLAYEIEDVVEIFLLEVPQHFHEHTATEVLHRMAHPLVDWGAFLRFSLAVKKVNTEIKGIKDLDAICPPLAAHPPNAAPSSLATYLVPREDQLVGIDKRASMLARAILESGSDDLAVVSVLGPHGSGKTTVLREVYKRLKDMFERCILISVPSASSPEGLLEKLVAAIGEPVPQVMHAENGLVQLLRKKRYAIFFDGISSKDHWNYIMSLLPNDWNGSRVIISTFKRDVAWHCACPSNNVHEVESLTWKESWRLLCKIAFLRGECPEHLVDCTEHLLKRCESLPAAVVAMGSLLSSKHQTPSEFRKLHDSLGHELGSSADLSVVERIWLHSYYHLSHNLKCCFLYFSNFPEDYSVTRGRLIRLWIAEHFVQNVSGKTLEEVAEEYLNKLIQMDLVLVSRRDFEGKVRSCRVQNLMLAFIVSKSENEDFCSVLAGSDTSSGDRIRRRRLSIQGVSTRSFLERTDLSRVRSLMMFEKSFSESMPGKPLQSFRLLRVLDFEDANLQDFPEEVVNLGLLRHLSLRNTEVKTIPKSIEKLQNLVTLDLRQTLVTNLPKQIHKLRQLVYLLVDRKRLPRRLAGVEVVPGIGKLASLQKLSLVKINRNNRKNILEELNSMSELRKLGISELTREDGKDLCESLVKMKNLYSLQVISATQQEILDLNSKGPTVPCPIQSLYLAGYLRNIPPWVGSLSSLAKLCLQWSRLSSSQFETLQALPSLVELKLLTGAYEEEELVLKDGWFMKLKMLQIEDLSLLEIVEVRPGAMPELTRLVIKRCWRLTVPPLGADNLKRLEDLLLLEMPQLHSLS